MSMSSASAVTASASASRPTWTGCRSSAPAIPRRDGDWNLYVRPVGGGPDTLAELKYDHDRLNDVPGTRVAAGRKWYRLMITGHDDPMLTAEPQLRRIEQGNFSQRALRRGFYPAMGR